MYPEEMVAPMKEDLTKVGFQELTSAAQVDEVLGENEGTVLVVVNSVCGCAAGNARPGVKMSVENAKVPGKLTTVFAGVDKDAVEQARKYMLPYPLRHLPLLYLKMENSFILLNVTILKDVRQI